MAWRQLLDELDDGDSEKVELNLGGMCLAPALLAAGHVKSARANIMGPHELFL